MLQIIRSRTSRTGALLERVLRERGARIGSPVSGLVCYGVRAQSHLPMLNGNAGRLNKFQELRRLNEAGVPTLSAFNEFQPNHINIHRHVFPVLGRKYRHTRGTDIVLVPTVADFNALEHLSDFWTEYVPIKKEFRVWIYRRQNLGTYIKELRHPEKFKGVNRNHNNGFAFLRVHNPSATLTDIAGQAVTALDLDFGAVDVLEQYDGTLRVIEVNTAPGIETSEDGTIRACLNNLATKIMRWEALGYRARKGT